jgi:hypothetical protein
MSLLDGLPALPSSVTTFANLVLLASDIVFAISEVPQEWGIFLDGVPVVVADNVIAFGFKQNARLSKYPQEQGAFASYNKVATPAEPRLQFSTGGSVTDRQAFLDSIAPLIFDLNLYDVVTPEATYSGYNVINYDYSRTADNAGLITVDVWLEEVVIAGASEFSNTTSPTDASQKNNGLAQGTVTRGPDLPNISGPPTFQ